MRNTTKQKQQRSTDPEGLDRKTAAALLGIGERTVWMLTNTGVLPHLRLGRRIVYPRAALLAWMHEQALKRVRSARNREKR